MKNKAIVTTAISGLLALGLSTANTAFAEDSEQCYGVAKAGKNDCQTATSACQGTSLIDNQPDAFILVPAGLCEKLVGGTAEPQA